MAGMISGAIFFREFDDMSPLAHAMFAIGMVGMAVGIGLSISPEAFAEGVQEIQDGVAHEHRHSSKLHRC